MAIEGQQLAIACARAAEQMQADDIRVIDIGGVSSLTDFMVSLLRHFSASPQGGDARG